MQMNFLPLQTLITSVKIVKTLNKRLREEECMKSTQKIFFPIMKFFYEQHQPNFYNVHCRANNIEKEIK